MEDNMLAVLTFPIFMQHTLYSCGAACFQMAVRHLGAQRISHKSAMRRTRCTKDGVTVAALKSAFRRIGLRCPAVRRSPKAITEALDRGWLVMVDDVTSYREEHFVLLFKASRNRFWVADPLRPWPRFRKKSDVCCGATVVFGVAE